jgi:hypothetical protein
MIAKGFLCSPHYFSTRYEKINVGWVGVFFKRRIIRSRFSAFHKKDDTLISGFKGFKHIFETKTFWF